jgi:hypothetical protein
VTLTLQVRVVRSGTVHVAVEPVPAAHPDHAYVNGSPSGSVAVAVQVAVHGTDGVGWQLVREIDTLRVGARFVLLKVVVTALAAFIVTVQAPVPVQAPLQPAKVEWTLLAAAVRDTAVSLA